MLQRKYPNTDKERYSVLKAFFDTLKSNNDEYIPVSDECFKKAKKVFGTYAKLMDLNEDNCNKETKRIKLYNELYNKSKLYIIHYYQMMNMAIERGELKPDIRTYYGLKQNENKTPHISNEAELIDIAKNLFIADAKRISEGGKYLTNPGIGVVKVWFEKFYDLYQGEKTLENAKTVEVENINEIRAEADTTIKDIWDNLEAEFLDLTESEKIEVCSKYGVVIYLQDKKQNISEQIEAKPEEHQTKDETIKKNSLQYSFAFPE
jgi:hypothetical protein